MSVVSKTVGIALKTDMLNISVNIDFHANKSLFSRYHSKSEVTQVSKFPNVPLLKAFAVVETALVRTVLPSLGKTSDYH